MVFLAVVFLRVYSIGLFKADIRQRLYFLPQLFHFIGSQKSCKYFFSSKKSALQTFFQSFPSVYSEDVHYISDIKVLK